MVCASRCTTWRTLVSWPGVPGTPALRKYLLTTISVASCDHCAGTSMPSMAKTVEPSGFAMTVLRRSHFTSSNGWRPGLVKRRVTWIPASVGALAVVVDFSVDTNADMRTSLVREASGMTQLQLGVRPGRPPGLIDAAASGRPGGTGGTGNRTSVRMFEGECVFECRCRGWLVGAARLRRRGWVIPSSRV